MNNIAFDNLEKFMQDNIPVARFMGISVISYDSQALITAAPIQNNLNDKGTGFAGSIFSIAAVSGWGFIMCRLADAAIERDVVLHRSEIVFHKPLLEDYFAESKFENEAGWKSFTADIEKGINAKIAVKVNIVCSNEVKAEFSGVYAALAKQKL